MNFNNILIGSENPERLKDYYTKLFGKPTRPELLRVGTKVQTYGAVTASTSGTAITPGTNAMGAYTASLGTSIQSTLEDFRPLEA